MISLPRNYKITINGDTNTFMNGQRNRAEIYKNVYSQVA